MPGLPDPPSLRRAVLAVCVRDDIDLEPAAEGVRLPGRPPVLVRWSECAQAVAGGQDAEVAHRRLADLLRTRRRAADLGPVGLAAVLTPMGLPVGHALHPGPRWARQRVLGGALDLGFGARALDPADPDAVVVLPPGALPRVLAGRWPAVLERLEELGRVAAERVRADRDGLLRPCGPCDSVTLLGARSLRASLAAGAGGLAAAVLPMRRRGWTRLRLLDPAFGPAAAAATDPVERGFPRPVLVTVDEVTLVPPGGRPERLLLGQAG